jgi:hypothetical protein
MAPTLDQAMEAIAQLFPNQTENTERLLELLKVAGMTAIVENLVNMMSAFEEQGGYSLPSVGPMLHRAYLIAYLKQLAQRDAIKLCPGLIEAYHKYVGSD